MSVRTSIFDHSNHVAHLNGKWSCAECHDARRPKNLDNSKSCDGCHREDMNLKAPKSGRYDFHARSYTDAMHGLCVSCHRRQDERKQSHTADCAFCHKQHKPGSDTTQRALSLLTGDMRP